MMQSTFSSIAHILASQLPGVHFPEVPKFFKGKIADVAEVNLRHCLQESGRWLENADGANVVLAIGKEVLQKVRLAFDWIRAQTTLRITFTSVLLKIEIISNDTKCQRRFKMYFFERLLFNLCLAKKSKAQLCMK